MKNINKILVGALSVLVLASPAFAQQKVDSLRRVLANAEQTKKRAERILRQDIKSETKYRVAKAARANYDRINEELDAAIRAKEQADRRAKEAAEEAKQKAEEAKQKAIEAKGWKLYQKKFPEFELVEGIAPEVKHEIARQLSQDPGWDIKSVSVYELVCTHVNEGYTGITITDLKGKTINVKFSRNKWIEMQWNHDGEIFYVPHVFDKVDSKQQVELVKLALKCRKDPVLLHETIQAQKEEAKIKAAQEKMGRYFLNYYKGYIGEDLPEIPRCNTIELYKVEIPDLADNYFYREKYVWYYGDESISGPKWKGTYFYYKCDDKPYLNFAHQIYCLPDFKLWRQTDVVGNLVKTFKVEDFM